MVNDALSIISLPNTSDLLLNLVLKSQQTHWMRRFLEQIFHKRYRCMEASGTARQMLGMQRSVAIEKALRQISRRPIAGNVAFLLSDCSSAAIFTAASGLVSASETHAALLAAVRSTEDALLVAQMWYDALLQGVFPQPRCASR
jgi:hypothetical protein